MATITTSVDVELDEFNDEDVFEYVGELIKDSESFKRRKEIIDLVNKYIGDGLFFIQHESLEDEMKIELLTDAFKKYSLTELEQKLS